MMQRVRRAPIRTALALSLVCSAMLAAAVSPVGTRSAAAQQSDVRITELDCSGSPEAVVITNSGAQPVDVSLWKLESDPAQTESFPLTGVGELSPGESVLVESGPGTEASFVWSQAQVFRDSDPTDFARVRTNTGETASEVACAAPVTTAPTPGTMPAAEAPVGGGSPLSRSTPLLALAVTFAGGWISAIGGAILAIAIFVRPRLQPASGGHPITFRAMRRRNQLALDGKRPVTPRLAVASAVVVLVAAVGGWAAIRRATRR